MTKPAAHTTAAMRRALQIAAAAVEAGDKLTAAVEFYPDGRIKVLISEAGAPEVATDPYQDWKSQRGDRAA